MNHQLNFRKPWAMLALSMTLLLFTADFTLCQGQRTNSKSEIQKLEQKLFDLPDVRFEKSSNPGRYPVYKLSVKQPIDHNDPSQGHFYQAVQLTHRGYDKPVVINTNGYTLESRPMELFSILKSNFVSVEHRFFGSSVPKGKPWKYLSIQQATADYHHIRQLLGKIYGGKWISTGISKGGETCAYYRFFYPDDVDMTIPYVAPFPNALKDQRTYPFIAKSGTEEVRKKIRQFQVNVLKNKKEIVPRFKYYLKGKGDSVKLIGGEEAAIELFVMEYPFGFFQSGKSAKSIPGPDATAEQLLDHLVLGGDFSYLYDSQTKGLAAHYYQHATQLGYYGYQTEPFGDLISKWKGEPSACFFPFDKNLKYDPTTRNNFIKWIQSDADDIIFIYGAVDTWTMAAANIGENKNIHRFILPGRHHGTARIRFAAGDTRKDIMKLIKEELESKN